MTEDVTAFADRTTRETLFHQQRRFHRRLLIMASVLFLVSTGIQVGAVVIAIRGINQEASDVHDHRIRNEQLHEAVCNRQEDIAKALGTTLSYPCPPAVVLNEGAHK